MKEFIITAADDGRKLDKWLQTQKIRNILYENKTTKGFLLVVLFILCWTNLYFVV